MSNQKMDEDVRGAVEHAAGDAVYWVVTGAVIWALGKAMNWAVERAVDDAVVEAVNWAVGQDPAHPALQDFLHSAALI